MCPSKPKFVRVLRKITKEVRKIILGSRLLLLSSFLIEVAYRSITFPLEQVTPFSPQSPVFEAVFHVKLALLVIPFHKAISAYWSVASVETEPLISNQEQEVIQNNDCLWQGWEEKDIRAITCSIFALPVVHPAATTESVGRCCVLTRTENILRHQNTFRAFTSFT